MKVWFYGNSVKLRQSPTHAINAHCLNTWPPECMNQRTRRRLKRPNFLQHSRILERWNPELLDHMLKPIPSVTTIPSWKRGQLPRICMKVPGLQTRGCQPEPERWSLTLEYVNTTYPEHQWTHAHTDSSAAETTCDGAGGVYGYSDGEAHTTIATGKYSNNFKVEAENEKSSNWDQRQPTLNQAQYGHLHRCSLSSANSKVPARRTSARWKLPWSTLQPRQT